MDTKFDYITPIKDIFDSLEPIDPKQEIPYEIKIENETYRYNIPTDLKIFHLFHSIEQTSKVGLSSFILKNMLSDMPVKSLDKIKQCTFRIFINVIEGTIEYDDFPRLHRIWYSKNTSLAHLINFILKKVTECGSFSIISIVIYGKDKNDDIKHRNIILAELIPESFRTENSPKVVLNYYEPYGNIKDMAKPVLKKILKKIQKDSEGKILVNYKNVSCPRGGIQTHLENQDLDIGYCIMYSYFWIYIVLKIIIYNIGRGTYEPSINWISEVEKYYVIFFPYKKLYSKVVSFADTVTKKYLEKIDQNTRILILQQFEQDLLENLQE
jgi:hypothetical protein